MNRSPTQVTFGRRRAPGAAPRPIEPKVPAAPLPGLRGGPADSASAPAPLAAQPPVPALQPEPPAAALPLPPAERDESWNRPRKRKRWLAEPYRTFSIVTGAGFGLSSWILPDSVQSVTDLVTGGLTVLGLALGIGKSLLTSTEASFSARSHRD